ncbi:cohesin domain-containing protein [Paenibacillus oryzisoli]|uniref:cohesin domain-containing protein n=1 Tax=Paenibacillus oryzisoli TaxID=1850517 RepID=UPI003D2AF00D
MSVICLVVVIAWFAPQAAYALPAIPQAAGYGMETPGGRGGAVFKVTSLADTNTPGTLRYALGQPGARTIIFEVSGTIEVNGFLDIAYPYVTVAGQTAPSPGIFLKGATIRLMTHDVLLQHLRAAPGDGETPVAPNNRDALAITSPYGEKAENIVIDHCTFTWSIDEMFETWGPAGNITFKQVLAAEPLNDSIHIDEGQTVTAPHGFGPVFDNQEDSPITMYGSLFSHVEGRLPYAMNSDYVQVNNVFYDRINTFNRLAAQRGVPTRSSLVGNVFKNGPSLADWASEHGVIEISSTFTNGGQVYLEDNDLVGFEEQSQWDLVSNKTPFTQGQLIASERPAWNEGLAVKPSGEVFDWVLANAGARPADRLDYEKRIVQNAREGTGRVVNSVRDGAGNVIPLGDVGGWPVVAEHVRKLVIPKNPSADDNGNGYTNLEEWLQSYAAFVEGTGGEPPLIDPADGEPEQEPDPDTEPTDPVLISNLAVNSKAAKADTWAIKTNLQPGDSVYTDRAFTFQQIPPKFRGSEWIIPSNDAKTFVGPELFSFKVVEDSDVYVAFDDRHSPRPAWLSEWHATGEDFIIASPPILTFSLYKKSFPAGSTVSMGDNGNKSNLLYLTLVKEQSVPAAQTGTAVITAPADGVSLNGGPAAMTGEAYDPDSSNMAITDIAVAIKQQSTNRYWNAATQAFDAPSAVVQSVYGSYQANSGRWSLDTSGIPFTNGTYTITAVVHDGGAGIPAVSTFTVAGPSVVLEGADLPVAAGQSFHVGLKLANVPVGVRAEDLSLQYDAQLFELVDVQPAAAGTSVVSATYDTPGTAHIITMNETALSGSADLLDLTFKVKNGAPAAAGAIRVLKAELGIPPEGSVITAEPDDITVRVMQMDINGSGEVNIGDLAIIVYHYRKDSSSSDWEQAKAADINQDDVIDVMDLALVAAQLLNE